MVLESVYNGKCIDFARRRPEIFGGLEPVYKGDALILPAAGAKILRICYLIIHNSGIITNYPYPIIHHPEI